MVHLSINILSLLGCVQYYLHQLSLKNKSEVTQALHQPLIDCINTLSHEDLITRLPSGDNLFVFLISKLTDGDSITGVNHLIFSTLIQRSAELNLASPQEVNPTIFLLTSANIKKQSPWQIIASRQNSDLLDFYLDLVEQYIAKKFMRDPDTIYNYPRDVYRHHQTPWQCPLKFVRVFFNQEDAKGFRLLNKLTRFSVTGDQFIAALDVLRAASMRACITDDEYKNIILHHHKKGHSVLHELVMAGDVDRYHAYLNHIECMYKAHVIDATEYKAIFCYMNNAGYSAVHQTINAPSGKIAQYFLDWFKMRCTLPDEVRRDVLKIFAETKGRTRPRRDPKLHQDASLINQQLSKLRSLLSVCGEHNHEHGLFFSDTPDVLRIDTESRSDTLSPDSTLDSQVDDDARSWSPWDSPLFYSPT
jgi:hypothetical protein